jgi:hypothetical protein
MAEHGGGMSEEDGKAGEIGEQMFIVLLSFKK